MQPELSRWPFIREGPVEKVVVNDNVEFESHLGPEHTPIGRVEVGHLRVTGPGLSMRESSAESGDRPYWYALPGYACGEARTTRTRRTHQFESAKAFPSGKECCQAAVPRQR